MDTLAQFHLRRAARNFDDSSTHDISFVVLSHIFINAGRNQLFHPELDPTLLSIEFKHLRLHRMSDLQHILRMIDSFLSAHVADVNHALDTLGNLHKGAKLRNTDDRSLGCRANGELLRSINPWIAKRL